MESLVIRILRNARNVIGTGWTQGAYARDHGGYAVSPRNSNACRWCMSAPLRSPTLKADPEYKEARDAVYAVIGQENLITEWNDAPGRTQEEVMAVFDQAIKLVELREQLQGRVDDLRGQQ